MPSALYEVTWTVRVTAASAQGAAKQARAHMIDPAVTSAQLSVSRIVNDKPVTTDVIEVQDPDRSNE